MDLHIVVPGERLGSTKELECGVGCYEKNGYVFASVVGMKSEDCSSDSSSKKLMNVYRETEAPAIPSQNDIIVGKISKIGSLNAYVDISIVDGKLAKVPFKGVIRKQDVRAVEKDKVHMYKCFRPGDIVRAEIISLGDAKSYHLSTAKNELGVIHALSISNAPLVPVSWEEMQCSKTGVREFRKCAKPSFDDQK